MAELHADERPLLQGLRVIDWTHVLAGPYASSILAQLGADVIRIERHDECDITRSTAQDPTLARLELGEGFVALGAGKKSIAVDARDPTVRAALARLIASADVLVENFRPGKLTSLGFDPRDLIERHPTLIVCSISGFGQTGANAGRRAYDHVIQATSGLMATNSDAAGMPQRVGFPIIDYATGMQAALAVLAALYRRTADFAAARARTRGEWIDVTMSNVALVLSAQTYASHAVSGRARKTSRATALSGHPLSGTFATAKGFLAVVCNSTAQSAAFLTAVHESGVDREAVDRLADLVRRRDVEGTHAWLDPVMRQRTAADWEGHFSGHQVPAAEVLTSTEAYDLSKDDDKCWREVALTNADGRRVRLPGVGFASTNTMMQKLAAPPLRGEHTVEVLRSTGMDDGTLAALLQRGAARIGQASLERSDA